LHARLLLSTCLTWLFAVVVPVEVTPPYTGWDFPLGKLSPWQPEQPICVKLHVGVLKDP